MEGRPKDNYIVVDGACDMSTGVCEHKVCGVAGGGISTLDKRGPFTGGTNNIVEFLAIVHVLAFCKVQRIGIPVYSDSQTVIAWVRDGWCNTNAARNAQSEVLFGLIERAHTWLAKNKEHNQVMKWHTKQWGENPADFGRK